MYYSFFSNTSSSNETDNYAYTTSLEYCNILESKLEKILSNIKGAGNVCIMVTLTSGPELKIATEKDERTSTTTNSSGTTTSVTIIEEPVIISTNGEDSPLVLMEILPVIKGVIVVAEGASNISVKLQLLEAVQSLLNIESSNIQIFTGI